MKQTKKCLAISIFCFASATFGILFAWTYLEMTKLCFWFVELKLWVAKAFLTRVTINAKCATCQNKSPPTPQGSVVTWFLTPKWMVTSLRRRGLLPAVIQLRRRHQLRTRWLYGKRENWIWTKNYLLICQSQEGNRWKLLRMWTQTMQAM